MRRFPWKMLGTIVTVIVSVLIMLSVNRSLQNLDHRSEQVGLSVAEAAIERSVMQCYALEGAYPPDLEYLVKNYGLILNTAQYVYQYEIVGSNIHPVIGVQLPGGQD